LDKARLGAVELARMPWFGIVDDDMWPTSVCLLYWTLQGNASAVPHEAGRVDVIEHNYRPLPQTVTLAASLAAAHEWCWYGWAKHLLIDRLRALHDDLQTFRRKHGSSSASPHWFLPDQCTAAFRTHLTPTHSLRM
jgi:hypothetical protein